MPELPEVETVRRSLEPAVLGQTISGLSTGAFEGVLGGMAPNLAAAIVTGKTVSGIRRRGKYLLIDFSDGGGIEIHLRMTGHLELCARTDPPLRFEHASIHFSNGIDIRFADQRKFGRLIVHESDPERGIKTRLGPEPLEPTFTAEVLAGVLAKRSAPIKSVLLDQRALAGVGNIYADEALFRARIHPRQPANRLTSGEIRLLHRNIRLVLRQGIERHGTSFSSYRDANGQSGTNQEFLLVYGRGRSGLPCSRCHQPLQYLMIGSRTSHYCPNCQQLKPTDDSPR